MMATKWLCAWSVCVSGFLFAPHAFAQAPSCGDFYRQKKFIKAGACFERKANGMGETTRLSKIQRYLKGQNLRNAALSYRKGAKTEQNAEKAAYVYERSLLILKRYLKENLCQKQYLCRLAKGESLEIINKIKYVQLSIITSPNRRAILNVQGYKYKIQHFSPPQWNKRVRPGRYKLKVKYEGQKAILREIIAVPGKAITITLLSPTPIAKRKRPSSRVISRRIPVKKPLPPKPAANPIPWLVAGSGLVVAIAGVALLLYGQTELTERDRLYNLLKAETTAAKTGQERIILAASNGTKSNREQMDKRHQSAAGVILPGWILAGAGGAIMVTGIVLFGVLKPSTPKTPPSTPKTPPSTPKTPPSIPKTPPSQKEQNSSNTILHLGY